MHLLLHLVLRVTLMTLTTMASVPAERPLADSSTEPKTGMTYSVNLVLSERGLNPAKPKGNLKCVVRNDTSKPVEVPVGYDGEQVLLRSGQLTLHPAFSIRDRASPNQESRLKMAVLRPGQEQVVFELPLARILRLDEQADKEWRWNWPRRPEPPRSPIHRWRQPGFNPQAIFQAKVTVGGEGVLSNTAMLQVKEGDPPR